MTMRPYNFKLDPLTVEVLHALADKHATSAAAVVRRAVRELGDRELAAVRQQTTAPQRRRPGDAP